MYAYTLFSFVPFFFSHFYFPVTNTIHCYTVPANSPPLIPDDFPFPSVVPTTTLAGTEHTTKMSKLESKTALKSITTSRVAFKMNAALPSSPSSNTSNNNHQDGGGGLEISKIVGFSIAGVIALFAVGAGVYVSQRKARVKQAENWEFIFSKRRDDLNGRMRSDTANDAQVMHALESLTPNASPYSSLKSTRTSSSQNQNQHHNPQHHREGVPSASIDMKMLMRSLSTAPPASAAAMAASQARRYYLGQQRAASSLAPKESYESLNEDTIDEEEVVYHHQQLYHRSQPSYSSYNMEESSQDASQYSELLSQEPGYQTWATEDSYDKGQQRKAFQHHQQSQYDYVDYEQYQSRQQNQQRQHQQYPSPPSVIQAKPQTLNPTSFIRSLEAGISKEVTGGAAPSHHPNTDMAHRLKKSTSGNLKTTVGYASEVKDGQLTYSKSLNFASKPPSSSSALATARQRSKAATPKRIDTVEEEVIRPLGSNSLTTEGECESYEALDELVASVQRAVKQTSVSIPAAGYSHSTSTQKKQASITAQDSTADAEIPTGPPPRELMAKLNWMERRPPINVLQELLADSKRGRPKVSARHQLQEDEGLGKGIDIATDSRRRGHDAYNQPTPETSLSPPKRVAEASSRAAKSKTTDEKLAAAATLVSPPTSLPPSAGNSPNSSQTSSPVHSLDRPKKSSSSSDNAVPPSANEEDGSKQGFIKSAQPLPTKSLALEAIENGMETNSVEESVVRMKPKRQPAQDLKITIPTYLSENHRFIDSEQSKTVPTVSAKFLAPHHPAYSAFENSTNSGAHVKSSSTVPKSVSTYQSVKQNPTMREQHKQPLVERGLPMQKGYPPQTQPPQNAFLRHQHSAPQLVSNTSTFPMNPMLKPLTANQFQRQTSAVISKTQSDMPTKPAVSSYSLNTSHLAAFDSDDSVSDEELLPSIPTVPKKFAQHVTKQQPQQFSRQQQQQHQALKVLPVLLPQDTIVVSQQHAEMRHLVGKSMSRTTRPRSKSGPAGMTLLSPTSVSQYSQSHQLPLLASWDEEDDEKTENNQAVPEVPQVPEWAKQLRTVEARRRYKADRGNEVLKHQKKAGNPSMPQVRRPMPASVLKRSGSSTRIYGQVRGE
jgi:hypothetical protein